MPELKLCKDCRWSKDIGRLTTQYVCANEKCGARIDPVDGAQLYVDCQVARNDNVGKCWSEGRYWEARDG